MKDDVGEKLRPPRAVLFDLDGTLVDSAPDLAASLNELLTRRGLPSLTLEQVRTMVGGGLRKLAERAFVALGEPVSGAALDEAERDLIGVYLKQLTRMTRLMPGAEEAVVRFHAAGIRIGVVTNKPQVATREILLHFGLFDRIGAIVGGDAVVDKKPAPDALLLALDRLRVEPRDALMVGDSATDVEAARAAGVAVALVRGGYSTVAIEDLGADIVCDSLADLPTMLLGLRSAA